jgi:hypothetical protein
VICWISVEIGFAGLADLINCKTIRRSSGRTDGKKLLMESGGELWRKREKRP